MTARLDRLGRLGHSPAMKPAAPTPSVLDWLAANHNEMLLGALVALGLVAAMLVARMIGQRMVATESDSAHIGWRTVIGRVLARTSIAFMVVAAVDMVADYAVPP